MPAVSKKQQRFFGYLLSNPDERKKKGISKKAAKDFAQDVKEEKKSCPEGHYYCFDMGKCRPIPKGHKVRADGELVKEAVKGEDTQRRKDAAADRRVGKDKLLSKKTGESYAKWTMAKHPKEVNEVAPPGWGHTKAEKEKTKPWKPKSKIGGSAAAFDRARKEGRFKGSKADMFKLMWWMKNKGGKPKGKPHYKPGTDKKYKKYQEEEKQITPMQDNNLFGNAYAGTKSPKKKKKLKEASYKDYMVQAQAARDRLKQKQENRKKKDAAYVDLVKKGVKFYDKKGSGRLVKGKKVYD